MTSLGPLLESRLMAGSVNSGRWPTAAVGRSSPHVEGQLSGALV